MWSSWRCSTCCCRDVEVGGDEGWVGLVVVVKGPDAGPKDDIFVVVVISEVVEVVLKSGCVLHDVNSVGDAVRIPSNPLFPQPPADLQLASVRETFPRRG